MDMLSILSMTANRFRTRRSPAFDRASDDGLRAERLEALSIIAKLPIPEATKLRIINGLEKGIARNSARMTIADGTRPSIGELEFQSRNITRMQVSNAAIITVERLQSDCVALSEIAVDARVQHELALIDEELSRLAESTWQAVRSSDAEYLTNINDVVNVCVRLEKVLSLIRERALGRGRWGDPREHLVEFLIAMVAATLAIPLTIVAEHGLPGLV
jgi:hypothetical protein